MKIASGYTFFRNVVAGVALLLITAPGAQAITYTFDTSSDLTNNFNVDVITLDIGTRSRSGYAASGGFPASDGGFVHFDSFDSSNSIQFKSGPVTLNSFQISSQCEEGGSGVSVASTAGDDYNLKLFDVSLNTLYDQVLTIASGGVWETLNFDISNVSVIWIARRSDDGTGNRGWWPNIDNIVANEAVSAVPLPAALPLFGTGLGLMGLAGWWRRRRAQLSS